MVWQGKAHEGTVRALEDIERLLAGCWHGRRVFQVTGWHGRACQVIAWWIQVAWEGNAGYGRSQDGIGGLQKVQKGMGGYTRAVEGSGGHCKCMGGHGRALMQAGRSHGGTGGYKRACSVKGWHGKDIGRVQKPHRTVWEGVGGHARVLA